VFCSSLFRQVSDVHQAEVVKVIPSKFSGSKEVVPLQMRKLVSIYAQREREREREREEHQLHETMVSFCHKTQYLKS
jgi:hypothetical protein